MRLKSKYRQAFKDGGRVDQPGQSELPIEQPVESASSEVPAVETAPEQPQPEIKDEAASALQRQIEELKRSEEVQRQQAAVLQQPHPVSREQKLALWRSSGMSEEESAFLQRNPTMIDFSELTGLAVRQAQQAGHKRGEPSHFDAVKKIFDANFERQQSEENNPVMQPTPKFFQPPPPPVARQPAHFVSAPVSRDPPGLGSAGPRGQVKLSPIEVEAARVAGVSVETYAREKVRYESMKESGEYRDNRDDGR